MNETALLCLPACAVFFLLMKKYGVGTGIGARILIKAQVLSIDEKIERFKARLEKRGVIATDAIINAVRRNNGNFTVYWRNSSMFKSIYHSGDGLEIYPVNHWSERSDTEGFTPEQWRFTGKMDCEQGVPACSDNEHYLSAYGNQYASEQIADALCKE